jgi:hypothetical protein
VTLFKDVLGSPRFLFAHFFSPKFSSSRSSPLDIVHDTKTMRLFGAIAVTGTSLALMSLATLTSCSAQDFEVWATDQSNTAPGQSALGVKGSFLWIWDGQDVITQVEDSEYTAVPLPCTPSALVGPCDILEIFPQDLVTDSTSQKLADLPSFGRLHGALIDPQSKYSALSMFTPGGGGGGGYIGIVDTTTKEAIGLFRVTRFGTGRSVHMPVWSAVRWLDLAFGAISM